ncbi:MAG TPA: N-acetyl-gamma-glutamyl-phosphate reductase [Longimicrobiales bacterium]
MYKERKRVGVMGASGYTGRELVTLLARHPGMELAFATSESEAGAPLPGGRGRYIAAESAELGAAELVFCCLPTGESGAWALRAREAGARVVDLSGDLRDGERGAVYGLPEFWRGAVRGATLVANPGCYPTAALMALAPAIRHRVFDPARAVVIDAASGVTGAGRSARRELLFAEVAEDYRAYGVGNAHRHVPELRRGFERLGGAPPFIFTPHLLPVRRGILETIYVPLRERMGGEEAARLWSEAYATEPFVEVLGGGALPTLGDVVGRNVVAIGVAEVDVDPPTLLVVAALDNLVKGAAGQAVQNANLMLGIEESEGLPR